MSYLALARKWRPRKFADVAGQDHVVRALTNSLASERVHHAYLFAGTRGVGKTTVARILAKALNCEAGVQSEPCGECSACKSIDEGRFVDLIEVDAASRTKVEQTRELLENVQYTPTAGRYKVYLIDEVHMLSASSFNALLKTLEEPPPHVKFLLATTDPQKLPVTVLSRCLQFNLKRLPTRLIVERMETICAAEGIATDAASLSLVARAAAGSMRDALSLLDQALAFGAGALQADEVAAMLGSMDQRHLAELLRPVIAGDAAALMEQLHQLQELVPDYHSVLDDLATVLQQVAVMQLAGAGSVDEDADVELLAEVAGGLEPEMVQLFYQIAVTGRRDISYAPDPRIGFEMALLRMLAFQPATEGSAGSGAPQGEPAKARGHAGPGRTAKSAAAAPKQTASTRKQAAPATPAAGQLPASPADWAGLIAALKLTGAVRQLAENSVPHVRAEKSLGLTVSRLSEHLLTDQLRKRLTDALRTHFGPDLKVEFALDDEDIEAAVSRKVSQSVSEVEAAVAAIESDPQVREIVDMFDAEIDRSSVRPAHRQTD